MSPQAESPSEDALLSLKIPPPAYFLGGVGLIYLFSRRESTARPGWRWLGLPLAVLGLGLDLHAFRAFRRHKTSLSPFEPEKAVHLVTEGAYRWTRNPMYLGLALMLSGWSLFRTSLSGLWVVPAFILTLTRLQIRPEENRLRHLFGDDYLAYQGRVRRWLGTQSCSVCALTQKLRQR